MLVLKSPFKISAPIETTNDSFLRLAPVAVFFIEAIAIVCAVLGAVSIDLIRKRSEAKRPDAHIVSYLFNALWRLQQAGDTWADLDTRASAMREIGHAAEVARRALLTKFEQADRDLGAWRGGQAAIIARAFSEKQTWLMTPMADTRDELYKFFGPAIATVINGYWDSILPKPVVNQEEQKKKEQEEQKENEPRTVFSYAVEFAQLLLVAALPAVIFTAVDAAGLLSEIDSHTRGYVKISLVAWAALTLLYRLDKAFGAKFSFLKTLKEAAQLTKGKDKED
jgi:hypothetical protein